MWSLSPPRGFYLWWQELKANIWPEQKKKKVNKVIQQYELNCLTLLSDNGLCLYQGMSNPYIIHRPVEKMMAMLISYWPNPNSTWMAMENCHSHVSAQTEYVSCEESYRNMQYLFLLWSIHILYMTLGNSIQAPSLKVTGATGQKEKLNCIGAKKKKRKEHFCLQMSVLCSKIVLGNQKLRREFPLLICPTV